ncbi:hypothetical protein GCM10027062_10420 [Nocardioides hungaricus]
MKILTWAAVAVTALFTLMNLGAVFEPDAAIPYRVVAAVLGLAGAAAAVGLATTQTWGKPAVVAVGVLNVVAAIIMVFTGQQGAAIGIVVGGLGAALGALADGDLKPRVAAQR